MLEGLIGDGQYFVEQNMHQMETVFFFTRMGFVLTKPVFRFDSILWMSTFFQDMSRRVSLAPSWAGPSQKIEATMQVIRVDGKSSRFFTAF